MEVRKRAIRIGALGAMLFATSSMVFNGIAGAEPAKPHPGHVHIDTRMKAAKGKKDIKLDRQCSVLLRSHDYRGYDDGDVTFTFDAHGKKPTASVDPIPVRVGDPLVYSTTPSWNSLEPVVLHLDAIKDMNIPPHGKRTFDKHGKEHNNLHWHVRIQGVDSLGKKFKKDVKVYNCDPRYAEADETMPDDEDTNPNHATTTTTTAPGGTTTTTAPGGTTTTTEPDADTCVSPDQMFANIRGIDNGYAPQGGGIRVNYIGDNDIAEATVAIDGKDQTLYSPEMDDGSTDLIVMVPSLKSGSHTVVFSIVDTDGDCSSLSISFKTNQSNGGPT